MCLASWCRPFEEKKVSLLLERGTDPGDELDQTQLFPYSLQQDIQPKVHLTTYHDILPFVFR